MVISLDPASGKKKKKEREALRVDGGSAPQCCSPQKGPVLALWEHFFNLVAGPRNDVEAVTGPLSPCQPPSPQTSGDQLLLVVCPFLLQSLHLFTNSVAQGRMKQKTGDSGASSSKPSLIVAIGREPPRSFAGIAGIVSHSSQGPGGES